MPGMSLTDSIVTSLHAQEPWPDNVKLFQPYEVEQILLPDNASCLAVQAFLKMSNLPFEVEMRWNAEFMSPSGRVPFIKCGEFVVSELEYIAQFAANKGVTLCSKLSSEEKAEMRAYMSLITNVLVNAELYISWLDQETFIAVTRVRNSSVYPWPLGYLQTRAKRAAVVKRLKALHWHNKTLEQVLADVEQCCNSLSQRLGDKEFFFGTPTDLDALIYGHVRALLSAAGPKAALMIKPISNVLLRHVVKMTDLTGLRLTRQEENLISQGLSISFRESTSEKIAPKARPAPRSRIRIREYACGESMKCGKDVFGYRPFASNQVSVTSKKGKMTCEYNEHSKIDDKFRFLVDILHEIIDKADEISTNRVKKLKYEIEILATSGKLKKVDKTKDNSDLVGEDTVILKEMVDYEDFEVIDSNCLEQENYTEPYLIDNEKTCLEGNRPTELDALVFGHVFTIITTRLPCRRLADAVSKCASLVSLAKRIDERYFKRP